jgi:BirA family biotin operon repressor/biotin-[acetyl-CoA-carboxylase] ligase
MNAEVLERVLAGTPIGPIQFFESTGSTNDEAARWIKSGAPDLALVVADEQNAGRGRAGRMWFTPPGAALAFSLVLNPPSKSRLPTDPQCVASRLTGLGALAVCQTLSQDYDLPAQIKWPNDVLLDGRKVAGVLVEIHWQGNSPVSAILGIGVNVSAGAIPPSQDQWFFPATCIQAHLENSPARPALLQSILTRLLEWYPHLGESKFLMAWEDSLAYRGRWVQIANSNGGAKTIQQGQIIGLESSGELLLRDERGHITKVHSGELRLRPV